MRDTGASLDLTAYRAEFFGNVEVNILDKDFLKISYVVGSCTVTYKFQNDKGKDVFLPCIAYHQPTAVIQLLNPQTYQQRHDQASTINGRHVVMHLIDHNIVIPINSGLSKLSILWDLSVSVISHLSMKKVEYKKS